MTSLGMLPGDQGSKATAINASGQVVGASIGSYQRHAFIYSSGTLTSFGSASENISTIPTAINASAQVAGDIYDLNSGGYGFLYSKGQLTNLNGLPGSTFSYVTAINANGQVVGNSMSSFYQPYLFSNGQMIALGKIPFGYYSLAYGINDTGQVVGLYGSADTHLDAVLFSKGEMIDLNSRIPVASGWTLQNATGINNSGQICGTGLINGVEHAFLLTPR